MIRCNPSGDCPKIDKTAYIDSSAVIIGKVKIGKNVFVAPGAVIRADETESSISIGDGSNIQDRVIIHALGNSSVIIGKNTSLSHGCIVHGPCKIGKWCFIGFGSVIFKALIKDNVFIKSSAVIEGVKIPNKKLIPNGATITSLRVVESLQSISKEEIAFAKKVTDTNLRLVKGYKEEEWEMSGKILVGIVMGSDSDLETMQEATKTLEKFGISYEVSSISAHRTPQRAHEYASSAENRGLEVIIAAAGGAAHLAGVIAAWTALPVIGVPMQMQLSGGLDSLLSMVQMPSGVPVACVATGKAGAKNSAILAAQILGVKYPDIREKLKIFKEQIAVEVEEKNKKLKEISRG